MNKLSAGRARLATLARYRNAALGVSLLALLLSACASQSVPEQHTYLLRVPPSWQVRLNAVTVDKVSLPAYLQRREVVVLVSPREIRPARFHSWGEPLERGIQRYLALAIAGHLGDQAVASSQPLSVSVRIDELLGSLDGEVFMRASFTLDGSGPDSHRGQFEARVGQQADGYDSLVAAHTALLGQLAQTIAAEFQHRSAVALKNRTEVPGAN